MRRRPRWPAFKRQRDYGTGSLSRDQQSGEIRARLPVSVSPTRKSRLFAHNQEAHAHAWIDGHLTRTTSVAAFDTVGEWTGHWHEVYVSPLRSPETARKYSWALTKLEPLYRVRLAELRTSQLQQIVSALSAELDVGSIKAMVGVWLRCLDAAWEDELIVRNPARKVITLRAEPRSPAERRHMTPAEMSALWRMIPGHRFEAAYALMLGCGLRAGEILGLHWEHVDLNGGRAWIQWQFTNGRWRNLPKGRNPHWIRLPDPVVAALRRQQQRQPAGTRIVMQTEHVRRRVAERATAPWPWSRDTVTKDLTALLKAAGIEPATPHAGRHGLATYWLDNGVPASVVAERLGHADAGVTHKFYSHASQDGHALADDLAAGLSVGEALTAVPEPESGQLGDRLGDDDGGPSESATDIA